MIAVSGLLHEECIGMDFCVSQQKRNLVLEVPKSNCASVVALLKQHFPDVALLKNALSMIEDLHDFILVKPLISESPLFEIEGVPVPELEKQLVDKASDKEFAGRSDADIQKEFQQAFEVYSVNSSSLLRYAGRKGKKEEIQHRIGRINENHVKLVKTIQFFFADKPVEKAWLFGSFSRQEERPDSDVDILVRLIPDSQMGVLTFTSLITGLEEQIHRPVDLVVEQTLKPFARDSVNSDKILIYERAS